MRAALLLTALTAAAQFKATTNLQQVAVQVTDKQSHAVHGLTAAYFTLSENGHPKKIAFFGAETEPVSLAILLDSSDSMKASHKLDRARAAIRAILHTTRLEDQIALIPFTDRTGNFIPLTPAERQDPPQIRVPSNGTGTALYDALATTLCNMRTSQKMKQALIVITDGADQSSRLRIEQLIAEAHASKPEIFMIGFWSRDESDDYRSGGPTLTLVNGHQIDNPIQVFARISRETGAESFFPSNDHDLEQVLQRILEIVQGQYTLSYYPENIDAARKIQVKVDRKGVTVTAPRSISAEAAFDASSCEVSKADHPYPWEPLVTHVGETIYRDDFSNPSTGWPNHRGSRYQSGAYEMSREVTPGAAQRITTADTTIAAYGPFWRDFKATLSLDEKASNGAGEGLVFRLNQTGCYTLLVTHLGKPSASFKLAKRTWQRISSKETTLIDWTPMPPDLRTNARLKVECKGDQISIWLNDVPVTKIKDPDFQEGQVGMAQFGYGRVLFHDLEVHSLP
jgi:VWFA-related protein